MTDVEVYGLQSSNFDAAVIKRGRRIRVRKNFNHTPFANDQVSPVGKE